MPDAAARLVVALAGLYLLGLGATAWLWPDRARRFLLGFAGTAGRHGAELFARALVGVAFVTAAPGLPVSAAFHVAGWVLVGTTAALALVPWRWHQRVAQRTVPTATRHLPALGAAALALGAALVAAVVAGL